MRRSKSYRQLGNYMRYTYECPRGVVAIDELRDGSREIFRCTTNLTDGDVAAALEMHRARGVDEIEDEIEE